MAPGLSLGSLLSIRNTTKPCEATWLPIQAYCSLPENVPGANT